MQYRIIALMLALLMIAVLGACSKSVNDTPDPTQAPAPTEAPAITSVPTAEPFFPTDAPQAELPDPAGADSVKTLLDRALEYLHNDCDYSKIEDVHDPVAYMALYFMEDLYRDRDMSLEEARGKAELLYTDAENLRTIDPELAELISEELDLDDAQDLFNEYMTDLRDSFRNGEITEENPDYEELSSLLTDWDKGMDYVFEHHPELREQFRNRGIAVSLDDAMDMLRSYARFEMYNQDLHRFRDIECEYRPENVYVDESGICSYDMGTQIEGNDVWYIDMEYYVEDATYYLICFSLVVGSMGG